MSDLRFEFCPKCKQQAATETDIDYEVYQCEECGFIFLLDMTNEKTDSSQGGR